MNGPHCLTALSVAALVSVASTAHASNAKVRVSPENPESLVTPAIAANMTYGGEPVITHVHIVVVLWGPNVAGIVTKNVAPFYSAITNSPYMDWLGEYDTVGHVPGTNQHIFHGVYDKTVTISPKILSGTIARSVIESELASNLMSGVLPMPEIDPVEGHVNTLYMTYFPPGIVINDGGLSCKTWCAEHNALRLPGIQEGIGYGVIPDFSPGSGCETGCGGTTPTEALTCSSAHELLEAMTDTNNGWSGKGGEIGDVCSKCDMVAGWSVQQCWSQRKMVCISTDPSLPLCDGSKRPCRSCVPGDCTGAAPQCVVDPLATNSGQCVAGVAGDAGGGAGDAAGTEEGGNSGGSSGTGGSSGSSGGGGPGGSSSSGGAGADASGGGATSSSSGGASTDASSGSATSSSSSGGGTGGLGGSSGGSGGGPSSADGGRSPPIDVDGGASAGGGATTVGGTGGASSGCACAQGTGRTETDAGSVAGLLLGAAAFLRRSRRLH